MATLASRIEHDDERQSRDVVKVVTALSGDALYFSRSPPSPARSGTSGCMDIRRLS